VLRSLRDYAVVEKAVRHECEKNDPIHNRIQTARSTSIRRTTEAHEGILLGYARFGAFLTAVLPCAAVDKAHCRVRVRLHHTCALERVLSHWDIF
jgi:hypothetical protein